MKKITKVIATIYLLAATNNSTVAQSWNLAGNTGTDPNTQFIGTNDNKAFKLRTNNAVRMTITSGGKIGLGIASPVFKLDVKDGSINTDSLYRIKGGTVLSRDVSGNIWIGEAGSKVGIGTSAPASMLDVSGNTPITGNFINTGTSNTGVVASCYNTPGSGTGLHAYGGSYGIIAAATLSGNADRVGVLALGQNGATENYGVYSMASGGSQAIGLYGTATGAVANWAGYFNEGNVYIKNKAGIGTTLPLYPLEVRTTDANIPAVYIRTDATSGTNYGIDAEANGAGATTNIAGFFQASGAANNYALIVPPAGGNVGIGTASPVQKLEVVGLNDFAATSGSGNNGIVRFHPTGTNFVMDIGALSTTPVHGWIQMRESSNYASNWPLALNPNGGHVGIGTKSPAASLHVKGAGNTNATSSFSIQSANSQQLFLVQDGGRVGIGTASPSLAALQVHGMIGNTVALFRGSSTGKGISIVSDSPGIYFNSYYNGGIKAMAASGYPAVISGNQTNGSLTFSTTDVANTTAGGAVTVNERMRITGDGKVGINTATPECPLQVNGAHGLGVECLSELWHLEAGCGAGSFWFSHNGPLVAYIDGTSGGWNSLSDMKFKKNIEPVNEILPDIQKLQLLKYHFNSQKENDRKYLGMVAQEVQKVFPEIVSEQKDHSGDSFLGMDYSAFGLIAVKGIQELQQITQRKNEELEKKVAQLEEKLNAMDKSLSECCMNHEQKAIIRNNTATDVARLEQNTPNPFSENTLIRFYIPQNATSGMIKIYSLDGIELKSFPSEQKGINEISVSAGTLASGVYVYTLLVDGKAIDTKQMILTR